MDVLSDVLRVASLGNGLLSASELVTPWAMEVGPKVRAAVHLVQRGVCWLRAEHLDGPVRLLAGDIIFIPNGATHILSDDPRTPPRPYLEELEEQRRRKDLGQGMDGERCALLCAEITFDQTEAHPLMSVLPQVIHISADAAEADEALRALARVLMKEASQRHAGAELLVPRLIDSLLILIVRHWLATHPFQTAGWLGALRDAQIGKALGLIHQQPQRKWTVEELAASVAMSRAVFARRFAELVGEPPLTYLTHWRLNIAAKRLRASNDSVEQIAYLVGYESATSFSNAFRRHLSVPPGQYRALGNAQ